MHIIAPHMSCVVNLPLSPDEPNEFDAALEAGYAEIYAITAEGIIKHHKLRGTNRYIRVKVDKVPTFEAPSLPQAINFLPAGKIPRALFDQIVAFFYKVMEKNGDKALEAMAHILWNPEQGYHIGIPPQQISAASVRYDWSYIPSGTSVVCDIHSHNNMNAFFSGTDNADDRANISFSGVVGQMNQPNIQTVWRFNYQDRKFEAKLEDIFEVTSASIPTEWLDKIEIPVRPAVTYARGSWIDGGPDGPRGRADHLKPYQYKSKDGSESVEEGPRAGPHTRNKRAGGGRDFGSFDDAQFWGLGEPDGGFNGRDLAGAAFSRVVEDPDPVGGTRLGKAEGEVENDDQNNDDVSASPWSDDENVMSHDRWDELVINNGEDAADAYCTIDMMMGHLSNQDDLIEGLMTDMIQLGSAKGQLKIFRSLFEFLSPKDQEKLSTQGL